MSHRINLSTRQLPQILLQQYQPLYLKYRPQSLTDLVGQTAVRQTLENAIAHRRISHAYLFTGPRGTGKTSSARILAKSLNCEKGPTAEPCQVCTACREIQQGISPAVLEIDAASNNSVDDARILIERAPLIAAGGRFKLYIIDECHMLTKEAFNALLKTIEEPPAKVVFILATTEEQKVPPTIVSRCQRLMFRLVNQPKLIEHLKQIADKEEINIENSAIELIARRSAGGLRDALGLLDQASLLADQNSPVTVSDLLSLLGSVREDALLVISAGIKNKDGGMVLDAVHALLLEGRDPAVLAQELARHFLNLAKAGYKLSSLSGDEMSEAGQGATRSERGKSGGASGASDGANQEGSPEYIAGLKEQALEFEPAELAYIVECIDKLEQTCRRSTQGAVSLQIGLLSICHRHEIAFESDLPNRIAAIESALQENGIAAQPFAPNMIPQAQAISENKGQPQAAKSIDKIIIDNSAIAALQKSDEPVNPNIEEQAKSEQQPEIRQKLQVDEKRQGWQNENTNKILNADNDNDAGNAEPQWQKETSQPRIDSDQFWTALLDELQRRHLPTYSLVSTHAFLLSLTGDNLVIGVAKEGFQKMLENKIAHIKTATESVSGRKIIIAVKAAPDARRSSQLETSARAPEKTSGDNGVANNEIAARAALSNSAAALMSETSETLPLKEAYRLFEGPGSRLIS